MAESLKKALEIAETASRTISEASRDFAAEIDKASKIIEESAQVVEQLTEQGMRLNNDLQKTVIDLQQDFHDVRTEGEKLVDQTKSAILSNVDTIKLNMDRILNTDSTQLISQLPDIKLNLIRTFEIVKVDVQEQANVLLEVIVRALTNCQKLIELTIETAALLKQTSEKTVTEAQEKIKNDIAEMIKIAQDLTKNSSRDFGLISDMMAQESGKIVDQVKAMFESGKTHPELKLFLEMALEEVKLRLEKYLDEARGDMNKSINMIQKQSEKAVSEFRKNGERTLEQARRSIE